MLLHEPSSLRSLGASPWHFRPKLSMHHSSGSGWNGGAITAGPSRVRARRDCCRAFACSWVDGGGSLAALQHLLGHSSITTTQRYGRISDSMVRAEVMRLA